MRRAAMTLAGVLFAMATASAKPLVWHGTLTQAQAVSRAQLSFDAQLAQIDAQSAAAQAHAVAASTLPQVSVSETSMNSTLTQLGMPAARQTYTSFSASLPIFSPIAWANARAAGSDAASARAAAAMEINDTVNAAVQKYDAAALTAAIAAQRVVDVYDQRAHLQLTKDLVRAGKGPRYLIARDQAALARAQQSEEDAQADSARAIHGLEVELNIDTASTMDVALEPPSQTFAPDVAQLEQRAYAQRPDVIAAQRAVTASRQRLARASSEYLPTISATAQTYNGTSSPVLGSAGSQVGVSASLPLIDGGSRSADVRLARANAARAQVQYDRTRLQAQADVLDAVRDLQAAQRNVTTADYELTNANEVLRIAQLRERAGKGIELEVLDALASVAIASEDVLRAAARYDDSLAAIHRGTGDYAPASF